MKQNYTIRVCFLFIAFMLCGMLTTQKTQAQCSGSFYFSEDFSNNSAGWTLGTEWGIGAAAASTCGGSSDPATDHTPTADNGVAGVVIGGCATTSLHGYYYLTSPVMNTASTSGVLELKFWRWLNSDYTPYMQNTIEVYDGTSWVTVWSSGGSPGLIATAWTQFTYDITAHKNANMQIRFGHQIGSNGSFTRSSWNIDDLEVTAGVYFVEDFADNSAGWTLGTEWGIAPAVASTTCATTAGMGQDPGTDHSPSSNNGIAGTVIGGCVTNTAHGAYYLTSPIINTASAPGTLEISCWRWQNSDYPNYFTSRIEVFDGTVWQQVWVNPNSTFQTATSWTQQTFDITAYKNANMQIRFGHSTGSGNIAGSGWNIDDVMIRNSNSFTAPTAVATPSTICAGDPSQIVGTTLSPTDNINWYDALTGGTLVGTSLSTANFAVTPGTTTTYYAQVNTCPDPRVAVTVTVDSIPNVTANPDQVQACNGDMVTLLGGNSDAYTWTGGITDNVSFTPTASTVYTVTGTDASGCSNTATADVTVGGSPTIINYSDDFETGSLGAGWTSGSNTFTTNVNATASAQGAFNLSYTSNGGSHMEGLRHNFTATQMTDCSWYMKTSVNTTYTGYVVISNGPTVASAISFCYFNGANGLRFYANGTNSFYVPNTSTPNIWHFVELKNFNWTSQTYDVYVNNVLIQSNFPFRTAQTAASQIHLYGLNSATNNYDDIKIQSSPSPKLSNATASNASSVAGTGAGTQTQVAMASMNYYNTTCDLIASLNNNATSLGATQADVTVDAVVPTHNGQPFTARWYQITPTNTGVGADVTLYYTQDDFDDYNAAAMPGGWPLLPANSTDAVGIANVMVTKNDNAGLGTNPVSITPTSVTWNVAENHWEVVFTTPSFSQFRVHGANPNNTPLPVVYKKFIVRKEQTTDLVEWTTSNERNSKLFNIQRSNDGQSFETLGTVMSQSPNGNSGLELNYGFVDTDPQIGHNYYRLEQVDIDNQTSLSKVIDIIWGAEGSTVSIYPNPATDIINIDLATKNSSQVEIKILDMSGRIVKSTRAQTANGLNHLTITLNDIATGIYGVQVYENNKLTHVQKIRKND